METFSFHHFSALKFNFLWPNVVARKQLLFMYPGARCVKKCKLTFTKWWKKLTAKNLFMIVFSCNFNLVRGKESSPAGESIHFNWNDLHRSVSRKFCRSLTRPKIIDTLTRNHSLWICRDYDVIIKVIQILNICISLLTKTMIKCLLSTCEITKTPNPRMYLPGKSFRWEMNSISRCI